MKTPHLIVVLAFCTLSCVGQNPANPPGTKGADTASAPPKAVPPKTKDRATKTKFKSYELVDQQQGGLVVSRLAIPEDWKGTTRVIWNYADLYSPVRIGCRLEAPDGTSWMQFYPMELFVWLDPAHDRGPIGPGGVGGIHHPNITLPEALGRYVVARNRGQMKGLRILGYRPVKDLPKAFSHALPQGAVQGDGICMRVQYQVNGSSVDEEFFAFMPNVVTIPGGNGWAEYHRTMALVHSIGAREGKLESVRSLLGFMATSLEINPQWSQRLQQIQKMQSDAYNRALARGYAQIQAAGQMSREISAQNDRFLQRIDAGLAANRAQQTASQGFSSGSNDDFYKNSDNYDQYIRGTEHMQDQYGQVTDQYSDYSYHWTDGFGRFVHTDDPNLDPNRYLIGNYERMTPVR